jgi:hypothetical protein
MDNNKTTRVKNLCTVKTYTAKDGTTKKSYTNYGGLLKTQSGGFCIILEGIPAPTIRKTADGNGTETVYILQVLDPMREKDPFTKTDTESSAPVADLTPSPEQPAQ